MLRGIIIIYGKIPIGILTRFEYYRLGESLPARTLTYTLSWEWIDQEMEGIKLNYGAGKVHYFENVWVRQNYLSGKVDGVEVTFRKE